MLELGTWDLVVCTGSAGFLGRRVRQRIHPLQPVLEVQSPRRAAAHGDGVISSDVSVDQFAEHLSGRESILVLHLATRYVASGSTHDVADLLESNVAFPTRIVQAAISTSPRVRIVNPSSVFQYHGPNHDRPISLYAASKEAFRRILLGFTESSNLQVADLVLGDTFAEHDHRQKLIPYLVRCAASGLTARLGSGRQMMSLMHADDAVDAFAAAARVADVEFATDGFRTWEPVGSLTRTVGEVVAMIHNEFEGRPVCSFDASLDRPREMRIGIDQIGLPTLPGFVASRSFADTIRTIRRNG
jgi:nucleoside-diphosphate-sugar epimerase